LPELVKVAVAAIEDTPTLANPKATTASVNCFNTE
jgi:hypothetical protein